MLNLLGGEVNIALVDIFKVESLNDFALDRALFKVTAVVGVVDKFNGAALAGNFNGFVKVAPD